MDFDTKLLYHNPDQLSDQELWKLRAKIRAQSRMPWLGAFGAGALMMGLFGPRQRVFVLGGTVLGYCIGCNAASSTRTHFVQEDSDIMKAFD